VGFLPDFDAVTGTTNQGGRRRGALLIQMDWDHPDIADFVRAKNFNSKLNSFIQTLPPEERPDQSPHLSNMNISVNAFGDFWENGSLIKLIAENMWSTGDPGLLFVDNMLRYSPLKDEDEPRFSNPCGEYLASAGTACNLITVNAAILARRSMDELYMEGLNPDSPNWTEKFCAHFFKHMAKTAGLACLLGNIILEFDEGFPFPDIRAKTQALKPVGVGMSGFHTALILAYFGRSVYGDAQAIDFAKKTQASLTLGTLALSAEMAKKTDHVYENFPYWSNHLDELADTLYDSSIDSYARSTISELRECLGQKGGFYNCLTTSQAPTGSVSIFLRNIDTGIEPFFSLKMERRILDANDGWITKVLQPAELWDIFNRYPDLRERVDAQTTLKLTPYQQINMLAAFQYHNHTGVSKTVNVPQDTTPDQIEKLIHLSRDQRLKGFTVYRDGSLQGIISVSQPKGKKYTDDDSGVANERESRTYTARSHNLKAHITLSNDAEKNIREVFVTAGEVGADINALFSAFGMILSTSLKCEPDLFIPLVNTLCKVRMGERIYLETSDGEQIIGNSLPHVIGLVLLKRKGLLDKGKDPLPLDKNMSSFDLCPDCHSLSLKRDGSCRKCHKCGFTTC
jgi:ribonucleoside-diphosphate reductase alpha chain